QPPDGRGKVGAGVDREHAGRFLRSVGLDRLDLRVRVRRAQEIRVRLVGELDVVGVLAGAGEEAGVFLALDARADGAFDAGAGLDGVVHGASYAISLMPSCTAFTML